GEHLDIIEDYVVADPVEHRSWPEDVASLALDVDPGLEATESANDVPLGVVVEMPSAARRVHGERGLVPRGKLCHRVEAVVFALDVDVHNDEVSAGEDRVVVVRILRPPLTDGLLGVEALVGG